MEVVEFERDRVLIGKIRRERERKTMPQLSSLLHFNDNNKQKENNLIANTGQISNI